MPSFWTNIGRIILYPTLSIFLVILQQQDKFTLSKSFSSLFPACEYTVYNLAYQLSAESKIPGQEV